MQSSLSYVTGSHALKVGVQQRFGWQQDIRQDINADLIQQYRNGVPTQVTVFNTPTEQPEQRGRRPRRSTCRTRGRCAGSPSIRGCGSTTSTRRFPRSRCRPAASCRRASSRRSRTSRAGRTSRRASARSYDLFGNGKTAIKGNLGAYVQSQGTGFAATYNPMVISTDVRTWTDSNRDDIAQENELGPTSNREFRRPAEPESGARHRAARISGSTTWRSSTSSSAASACR